MQVPSAALTTGIHDSTSNSNTVDTSATSDANLLTNNEMSLATFTANVSAAFAANRGGVIDFEDTTGIDNTAKTITAVLITILLPTLSKAREVARRAVCLSNLHQMGIATRTPAVDHKGDITPGIEPPAAGQPVASTGWSVRPFQTYLAVTDQYGNHAPVGATVNTNPYWIGYLYGDGLLNKPDYFYCPSQTNDLYTLAGYQASPWGLKP